MFIGLGVGAAESIVKAKASGGGGGTSQITVGGTTWDEPAGMTRYMYDLFNGGVSGDDLTTHTSDSGHTWARNPGASSTSLRISGDGRMYNFGSNTQYIPSVDASSQNQVCFFHLDVLSLVASLEVGVLLRADTAAVNGYMFSHTRGNNTFRICKVVTGTATSLATYAYTVTAGETFSIKCEAIGTALKMYIDGVERVSTTDATYSNAGRIGPRTNNAGSTATTGMGILEMHAYS